MRSFARSCRFLLMVLPLAMGVFAAAGEAAHSDHSEPIQFRISSGQPKPQPESPRRMFERLTEIDRAIDPSGGSLFFPAKSVQFFQVKLAEAKTPDEFLRVRMPFALALLNNGQSKESLEQMAAFEKALADRGLALKPEDHAKLLEMQAIAYLRVGEQENCLHNHNADSCLLPIRGGGVHKNPRGSRAAIAKLDELLAEAPSPFAAWLLNIAYMTLGEYPDKVPPQWLVPRMSSSRSTTSSASPTLPDRSDSRSTIFPAAS